MVLAQFDDQPFGSIPFAVVFLGAILFDDRLGHQSNDFTLIRMDKCRPEHVMGIDDGAVSVVALSTRLAVNLLGGKIACAFHQTV